MSWKSSQGNTGQPSSAGSAPRYVAGGLALAAFGLMSVGWTWSTLTAGAPSSYAASYPNGHPAFGPSRLATSESLYAVAATSAKNAWAVGTVIEHWNGQKWSVQPDARTGKCHAFFLGVAARSSRSAWAVGACSSGSHEKAIIERWTGRRWTVQPSPIVPGPSVLSGVSAISASDAWAVGHNEPHSSPNMLIEHWNGHAWNRQHAASAGIYGSAFTAITAVSANDVWAVGYRLTGSSGPTATLIEHWNGHTWKVQTSIDPGSTTNVLLGVAATSSTRAWTVGAYSGPSAENTLAENWYGQRWLVQSTVNPEPECYLQGVAASSASDAWAVGLQYGPNVAGTLIEHWDGGTWALSSSPDHPSSANVLQGVAVVSSSDAWAVGSYGTTLFGRKRTLIEFWNGHSWKIQASPN